VFSLPIKRDSNQVEAGKRPLARVLALTVALLVTAGGLATLRDGNVASGAEPEAPLRKLIPLPQATIEGSMSLEEALARRRSVRKFAKRRLTEPELSQLLWAAQGTTHRGGYRTAPSAGALYPLELYVATEAGFYHFDSRKHELRLLADRDLRSDLSEAALGQDEVRQAPAVFLIAAVYERTSRKYGKARGPRYVHLEAGHAAQNLLLQAVALNLGAVPIGAFEDAKIRKAISLPTQESPLYLIPVGAPR
jgi:SagB-type dehydrogenase family enzyme